MTAGWTQIGNMDRSSVASPSLPFAAMLVQPTSWNTVIPDFDDKIQCNLAWQCLLCSHRHILEAGPSMRFSERSGLSSAERQGPGNRTQPPLRGC